MLANLGVGQGFRRFVDSDSSRLGLDSNFLMGDDMSLDAKQSIYLSGGPSSHNTTDQSPIFFVAALEPSQNAEVNLS